MYTARVNGYDHSECAHEGVSAWDHIQAMREELCMRHEARGTRQYRAKCCSNSSEYLGAVPDRGRGEGERQRLRSR